MRGVPLSTVSHLRVFDTPRRYSIVAQINEFAIIRDCWVEKTYLASTANSQIKMESCYLIFFL